ncbi:ABC-type multidrug transport system, ATPase component [Anaerocolumna jejuensis DSM 15929]|uniref:ABC-type multidrug transport system, ATPase component n=2 Tax=Anaerocolumna TaxID=1843210 RepID=A0A1M6Q107_9FIRM|nr:ABC-type multidrug transport system, ATPase component [Anaerocolumna jejuensis DSM 15929]
MCKVCVLLLILCYNKVKNGNYKDACISALIKGAERNQTFMKIEMKNLDLLYPSGKQALDNVSLTLDSPNLIGLLGQNGAGKSTLMKLLVAGLLPSRGDICVDGRPLVKCEKEVKTKLGYLPQSFGLYDELTVWQFLDYMSSLKGIKDSKAAIKAAIAATGLEEKQKARIQTLSGGQRQRVGIAQAMLGEPELLIFDEPTVGLDPEERIRFRNLFSHMAQDKIVLLSTHIIEDVQSVCNQLIVIHHGRILFTGGPEELIQRAEGHVGTFIENSISKADQALLITSRVNTAHGISCRGVADTLPDYATTAEPSLEDAYLYLIEREGALL